jgi:hypothetical protein
MSRSGSDYDVYAVDVADGGLRQLTTHRRTT